jgi:hypothetical protein
MWDLECDISLQARFSVNSHNRTSKAKVRYGWVRWYSGGTKIINDYKFYVKTGIIITITSYIKVFPYIGRSRSAVRSVAFVTDRVY